MNIMRLSMIIFLLSGGLCRGMNKSIMSQVHEMGRQFLKAQKLKDQSKFKAIMNDAVQKFRNNKEAFYEFLDFRDGYGCTCLIRAVALLDVDQITFILEKLEKFYTAQNDGLLDVFNFLNAKCLLGQTAFYLLAQNGTREQLDIMFYHVIRFLGSEKKLFLEFLNSKAYGNGWTILHWLAFQGAMPNLEAVAIVGERILGKDSEEYGEFINAQSLTGRTPLDNTYFNARHRQFILQNGGVSLQPLNTEVEEARKIGLALIDAIRDDKFDVVQKIILEAQKKYKETPHLFYELMTVRSPAGWDPLMHAVGINEIQYQYPAFLLHTIKTFFVDDEDAFYSIMRSVAQDGRGSILISILQRNFTLSQMIIKTIKEYAPSKYFLYILINIQSYGKGFTPLLAAVNFSSDTRIFSDIIRTLVETVAELFGKDTRPVLLFVNSRDFNGYPTLAYANTPYVTKLLIRYGALFDRLPF